MVVAGCWDRQGSCIATGWESHQLELEVFVRSMWESGRQPQRWMGRYI